MAVIAKLKQYIKRFDLSLIAYCLMPNHYHFLVRQDGQLQARHLPQRTFNSYAKSYNRRYNHSGTIFEGPYRVKLVDKPDYLLHLCRYIHGNPVKDGITTSPELWPYSNYQEWVELRRGTLVDREFVAHHFPEPTSYKTYLADYIQTKQLPTSVKNYLNEIEG